MGQVVKKGSAKARRKAARLVASQAVYQNFTTEKTTREVVREFLDHHLNQNIDGMDLVTADAELLSLIIQGTDNRKEDIVALLEAQLPGKKLENMDDLLQSILMCGVFELLENQDTDAPIIINDYMDVAKAFYEKKEAGIVNAVLDGVGKKLR